MKHPVLAFLSGAAAFALFATACGGGGTATPAKTETKPSTAGESKAAALATSAKTETKAETQATGKATGEPIKVGIICDRSGAVANNTIPLCDGMKDWFDYLNNAGGGVKGRPIEAQEIDFKYEVPIGVDAYKKMTTRDGIPQLLPLGTPLIDALTQQSTQDKVILWSPGFGVSEAADGERFPYIFPAVATYHSQAMAIMQYVAEEWKAQGGQGNPKVVYVYYDNPAGRDPLELIKQEAPNIGLDVIDTVAVPATTVDMTTIMTQVKDKNPDYVISHLFGRTPALSLQAAEKVGYPRDRMISFVWGFSENEVQVAGPGSEGYRGAIFHGHYSDNPRAYQIMEQYWQQTGKQPHPQAYQLLYYPRGFMVAQFMAEAARLADDPNNGESLKKGIETMKDFTANELLPGTTITPADHGGSRKVRIYQIKDGKVQQVKDWFEGPKP